jgi:hypothetical protein
MKNKLSMLALAGTFVIGLVGCSSDSAKPAAEEKKAFMGGPMPKGFDPMKAGQDAGEKAAAEARAAHK